MIHSATIPTSDRLTAVELRLPIAKAAPRLRANFLTNIYNKQ
ncbi:MAG: hypothetical protein ACFCU7_16820 [Pleurocapsa sp.]